MIRALTVEDASICSQRHVQWMERSLHTSCGSRWMEHLYRIVAHSPNSFGLVEEEVGGNPLGVIVGVLQPTAFTKEVLVHTMKNPLMVFRLLRGCLCNFDIVRHDSKVDRYTQTIISSGQYGYLAFIWVHPEQRGKGVGRRLIQAFKEKLLSHGISRYYLYCTKGNEPAQHFYRSLGCEEKGVSCGTSLYLGE